MIFRLVNICEYCLQEYKVKPSVAAKRKHCSRKCSDAVSRGRRDSDETKKKKSLAQLGNKKMLGKSHSEETKTKIRNSNLGKVRSKESCKRISESKIAYHKEHANSFKGKKHKEETKKIISEKAKIRNNTPQNKERMSKWNAERILNNDGANPSLKHTKKGIYNSTKVGTIRYDSSYEERAYEILDQLPKVNYYSRCDFSILYEFRNQRRRYIPDILVTYVNGSKKIIEIKPYKLINQKINQAKFKAAEKYAKEKMIEFVIWSETDLF